ncbi:C-type lectin [Aphelenchoides besseyi]|nr:C-type lectin [Aphelenchoides besseyi]
MFLKNRCIVQREDVTCAEILSQCQHKFPQFTLMDTRQLEAVFVKHIQKLNFFKSFKANGDFCVIINGYDCPAKFFEFNGLCYRIFPERKNYAAATKSCESAEAHLVEIHDDLTNAFVENLVVTRFKQPIWLGVARDSAKNLWQNFDGTQYTQPIYFRWMFFTKGHDNALIDYGIYNGYWKSAKPTELHPFVCQRKAVKS